jgi:AcrR family transcriptional regulator
MDPKERIQAKADELFMQYGIRSISMDDIAAGLAMSKKTLYQFFADKDELVDAVVDKELKKGSRIVWHAGNIRLMPWMKFLSPWKILPSNSGI